MNLNIKLIIFDLDGVVVFTDHYHYAAWNRLSKEMGWDFNEQINHQLRGVSRLDSLNIILQHNQIELETEEKERLSNIKNKYYVELLDTIEQSTIYPGVVSFIKKLRQLGVKTALCSASCNANTVLERLDLVKLFDVIVTGADVKKNKPNPEIFLNAAQKSGCHPFNCLVFEDAPAGIEAAKNAEMKVIGVGKKDTFLEADEMISQYEAIDMESLLTSGRTKKLTEKSWSIVEDEINLKRSAYWESIFCLSNGYLGLRGSHEEKEEVVEDFSQRGFYLNGIFGYEGVMNCDAVFKDTPIATIFDVCDWNIVRLKIDGELFSLFQGKIENYRRELDFKEGILTRCLKWTSPKGHELNIESTRLLSMTNKHQAAFHYTVTSLNYKGSIQIKSVTDIHPGKNRDQDHSEKVYFTNIEQAQVNENISGFLVRTKQSNFTISMGFAYQIAKNGVEILDGINYSEDSNYIYSIDTFIRPGENLTLCKYAAFFSSDEYKPDILLDLATTEVSNQLNNGFGNMLNIQKEFWNRHWETGDIKIEGNIQDQQAIRFNLFHLRQNHPESNQRSISATGVTGDNYRGHIFWDTEIYMLPYFNYTNVELVKSLLMYRYSILEVARENTRKISKIGIRYPWNTIDGMEYAWVFCGIDQYHINSDIAYGIWRYYQSTRDDDFMYNFGAEMVIETARFLYQLGHFDSSNNNRFVINTVCGPDEYHPHVNNNCYTNAMAKFHLTFARELYDKMKQECPEILSKICNKIELVENEPGEWKVAAEKMYLPYHEEMKIHGQDDAYLSLRNIDMSKIPQNYDIYHDYHKLDIYRQQVTKQADVILLMFLLGNQFTYEQKKANYEYYEPRTDHGSSLSPCMHSILAAEVGDKQAAYRYLKHAFMIDLYDFKGNTGKGLHFAGMGGAWMGVVNGITGMRDYENMLLFNPQLPEEWDGYQYVLTIQNRKIKIVVNKKGAEFTLLAGRSVKFYVHDKIYELTQEKNVYTQINR